MNRPAYAHRAPSYWRRYLQQNYGCTKEQTMVLVPKGYRCPFCPKKVKPVVPVAREENVEPLLTIDEAAALLKLTRAQMYEITRGRARARQKIPIPVIRIGKRKMFRAAALQEWVIKLEQQESI